MAATRPICRNGDEVCVHVSTKNVVDTMLAAANRISNEIGLDAYKETDIWCAASAPWRDISRVGEAKEFADCGRSPDG